MSNRSTRLHARSASCVIGLFSVSLPGFGFNENAFHVWQFGFDRNVQFRDRPFDLIESDAVIKFNANVHKDTVWPHVHRQQFIDPIDFVLFVHDLPNALRVVFRTGAQDDAGVFDSGLSSGLALVYIRNRDSHSQIRVQQEPGVCMEGPWAGEEKVGPGPI